MRWFRYYSEALDDPKVQRLPGDLFKSWVNLLCLANDGIPRGTLPSIEDIGFRLRMSPTRTRQLIDDLTARGLLDCDGETLQPHNWDSRQRRSDNVAERVQKHRRNVTGNVTETAPVTPPDTDTDTDTDTDSETDVSLASDAAASPRPRDAIWDTQVEIFGFSPTPKTPEHGRWNKATAIWRAMHATPDDMRRAASLYATQFAGMDFNAMALANRAENLLRGQRPHVPPRVEDIKNPMTRAILTTDLSDIRAELEAKQRDTRGRFPGQVDRPVELPADARRLGAGGQRPVTDVLPPSRRAGSG